jgi:hypothetical protein
VIYHLGRRSESCVSIFTGDRRFSWAENFPGRPRKPSIAPTAFIINILLLFVLFLLLLLLLLLLLSLLLLLLLTNYGYL